MAICWVLGVVARHVVMVARGELMFARHVVMFARGVEVVLVRRCRRLPRVLVVRLKRFHQAPGAKARRIDAPVHRLEDDLDLAAHLDAAVAPAGDPPAAPANSTRYRARAIVCHHEKEGHYTCWIRAAAGAPEDSWRQYDDSTVGRPRGTLPPDVSSEALLLFYEQNPVGVPNHAQPAGPGPDRRALRGAAAGPARACRATRLGSGGRRP